MIEIRKFVFNPFQVNTYLLWDQTGKCIIIDAGCHDKYEEEEICAFIDSQNLVPVRLLNTHSHIDHIAGNAFIVKKYGLKLEAHAAGLAFIDHSHQAAAVYGFDNLVTVRPDLYLEEGDRIGFGSSFLDVVYTPGHADGSVCFISHPDKFVIVGDVLFSQSIGRTDLPTGSFPLLLENINTKLLTLPRDYTVYPGHGPETSIGIEMMSNPFLTDLGA